MQSVPLYCTDIQIMRPQLLKTNWTWVRLYQYGNALTTFVTSCNNYANQCSMYSAIQEFYRCRIFYEIWHLTIVAWTHPLSIIEIRHHDIFMDCAKRAINPHGTHAHRHEGQWTNEKEGDRKQVFWQNLPLVPKSFRKRDAQSGVQKWRMEPLHGISCNFGLPQTSFQNELENIRNGKCECASARVRERENSNTRDEFTPNNHWEIPVALFLASSHIAVAIIAIK